MTLYSPIRHPEWVARTEGSIRFTRDVAGREALVGRVLRSPHAHAEIVDLDVSAAERAPGVLAVVTGRDLPARNYKDYGQEDRPAMARDVAVHYGQEVAAIAAETAEQAEHALGLVRVRYRPRKAAVTLDAALREGAPAVHPGRAPDNVATEANRAFGDPAAARARAVHRVAATYETGIQAHACMEPHAALASWDEASGTMNVWCPTQSPRGVRAEIAWLLGLDPEKVRLHRVAIGGDFGSRVKASDIEVLAAALSRKARRPVCIALSRADEFAFTKRQHECRITLETGADAEGILTHREAEVTVENGAFIHGGSNMMNYSSILLGSQYRLDGAEIRGRSVYTHRRPGGAFRGAGGPQAAFAIECQMDELADRIGVDPIDLRLRNLNREGDRTITGWEIRSVRAAECLAAVRERLGWDEARRNGGKGRGVGVALAMHVSGAIVSPATGRAEARIEIGHNGGVVLSSGCADPGTGEFAVIAQICAAGLGLRAEDIDIRTMDTATTPFDPGAGSSRATMITGGAVRAATRKAATALKRSAAERFGCAEEAVSLEGGFAVSESGRLALGELAAAHPDSLNGTLLVECEEVVDSPVVPMTATDSGYGNLSPAYAFAAHGVEVEVDAETGAVRVLRVVAAHDAGTIVNPVGARGQVVGGVVMGIGAAIGEELVYEEGRPVVTSFLDYAMPRASGAPPVEVVFVGDQDGAGPFDAKSIAEIALMPTAAAVANAVAHATGRRIRSLPLSPDKVAEACAPRDSAARPGALWSRPDRWWAASVRRAYPLGLHALLHGGTAEVAAPRTGAIGSVLRPASAAEALEALAADPAARAAGGATDILALRDQGFGAPATIVSLVGCGELTATIEDEDGALVIGAAERLADLGRVLERSDRPGDRALAATVAAIATPQIRESATVAGNLCQAKRCWFFRGGFNCYKRGGAMRPCYAVTGDHRYSHAVLGAGRCQAVTPSDLATTLTALDAMVCLAGPGDARRDVPMNGFYAGPGETIVPEGWIVHSIRVPSEARGRATSFQKFARTSDGFAIVSACASLVRGAGGESEVRAVLGGIANRPYRAERTEALLRARPDVASAEASLAWARDAHPLPGNRWKIRAAAALLRRALDAVRPPSGSQEGAAA